MKKEGKLNFNLINLLLVMLIIYLLFVTSNYWAPCVGKLINVLIPFFLAFVFAYILDPFVKFFERKGVSLKFKNLDKDSVVYKAKKLGHLGVSLLSKF